MSDREVRCEQGRVQRGPLWRGSTRRGLLVAVATALAGCGTAEVVDGQASRPAGGTGFGSALGQFFAPPKPPAAAAEDTKPNLECPPIDVRSGTAAFRVYGENRETGQQLRYQATVGQTARECNFDAQTVTMRIGVEGRLLAGPGGSGAPVSVPLRIAVVREGTTPRPIVSKLTRIPVQIPPGQQQTTFVHIEENVSFPLPAGAELDWYVVYVGFDPNAPAENPRQNRRRTAAGG